ncbi:hypothetical protein L3V83_09495 [Thiotrichales bacterium 19X7-9]|nr:hypothetical protein [Thiotrichales bacterium 19X7-9]
MMIQYIRFILYVISINLLSVTIAYADRDWYIDLKNNGNVTVKFSITGFSCMEKIDGMDDQDYWNNKIMTGKSTYSIVSKASTRIEFRDNDGGGCDDEEKSLYFRVEFSGGNSKDYVEWAHKKWDGHWHTRIYGPESLNETFSGSDPGNLMVISAVCEGQDCYEKWNDNKDKKDNVLTVAKSFDQVTSIGLGDVYIYDGVGHLVEEQNDFYMDKENPYIIRFTASQAACSLIAGFLSCDHGINFSFRTNSLVFFCRQGDKNDSACPWAMPSGVSANYNNVNIY